MTERVRQARPHVPSSAGRYGRGHHRAAWVSGCGWQSAAAFAKKPSADLVPRVGLKTEEMVDALNLR
jgi:hypothetical protein